MPYLLQAAQTFRMSFEGTDSGRPVVNVLHFTQLDGGYNQTSIDQHVVRVRNAWQSEIMDQLVNNYTFTGGSVLSLDPNEEIGFLYVPNGSLALTGTLAGDAESRQVSVLVSKITPVRPRGFRGGRMYLGRPQESDVAESGNIGGTRLGLIQASLDAFFDEGTGVFGDDTWAQTIPSWPGLESPPPEPVTPVQAEAIVVVESLSVQTVVATQRRRLRA